MQVFRTNPFLGLKPYELKDRKRLYGRDKDLILMKDRIFSARTTLLFAGSGVGKTSFLNAKIRPEFEAQYCVIYHNQWTGTDEPLAALKKTLWEQMPPDLRQPDVSENGAGSLLSHLGGFKKAQEGSREQPTRCLLILDQFEEIFQYHAFENYFGQFVRELSDLINDASCNIRVLFSMREEFLGELSIFDNHIPDLFNNYYRLKCPNKLEAQEIIQRTCAVDSITVDEDNLKNLVDDLAKVEKGEAGTVERLKGAGARQFVERDFVAPPYLQIACQRLWDSQFVEHKSDAPFLATYATGDARKMLNRFCEEKLSSLSDAERRLLVDAFDFLVTKKGAKMAYELPSLAEHMATDEEALKSVLLKLSSPESRILRASSGPDGVLWFELYHDMYAPIVDEWKRNYRLAKKAAFRKQVVRASISVGIVLLVILTYLSIHHWYLEPRWYKQLLSSADLQNSDKYQENESAFIKLHDTFGFGSTAKKMWADAWRKRAINAERQEKDQEALLSWLQAANYDSSPRSAQDLQRVESYLKDFQYESLLATFRTESAARPDRNPPLFSADGKTLLTFTDDLRVLWWNAQTGEFLDRSPQLQTVNYVPQKTFEAGRRDQDEDRGDPTKGPQFRSVSENLLAGFSAIGFFILRIDNSSIFWSDPPGGSQPRAGQSPKDISFSPDGKYLGTVEAGGTAKLYKLAKKQQSQPNLKKSFGSVNYLTFSPNNRFVLLQLKNQTVQLWDLDNEKMQAQKPDVASDYPAIFTPAGGRILFRTRGHLVDGATLSTISTLEEMTTLISLGGNSTVLAGGNTFVHSFNFSGKLYLEFQNSLTGDTSNFQIVDYDSSAAVFNPNGESILSVSDSGVARLRNVVMSTPAGRAITQPGRIREVKYSKDRRTVAILNEKGEITLWSTDTAQQLGAAFTVNREAAKTDASEGGVMILSPDAKYVGVAYRGEGVRLWEVATRREIQLAQPRNAIVISAAFSADSRVLVTGTSDGLLKGWKDFQNPVEYLTARSSRFYESKLSPDGRYLAAVDRILQSFELIDLTTVRSLSIAGPRERFGGFSKSNTAIGSKDNEAFVWNLKDGVLAFKLSTQSPIIATAISSDGKLAMTSCNDGTLQLWSLSTGQMIGAPQKFEKGFSRLEFSGDNTRAIGFSERWLHVCLITDRGLQHESSRLTGSGGLSALNESGTQFRRIRSGSVNTLAIEDIFLEFPPGIPPPALSAQQSLLDWQRKLDVQFDDRGQIVPRKPNVTSVADK